MEEIWKNEELKGLYSSFFGRGLEKLIFVLIVTGVTA
jgi:hypothetical protein